jgi:hypothetical protein
MPYFRLSPLNTSAEPLGEQARTKMDSVVDIGGYMMEHRVLSVAVALAVCGLGHVVYMRYLHPLAKYPGPFVASFTHLWKAYTMYQGQMEHVILDLHRKHGAIVRIGPNDLVISHPHAVKQIYLSGSSFIKVNPLLDG